jgi:hypothetical protein
MRLIRCRWGNHHIRIKTFHWGKGVIIRCGEFRRQGRRGVLIILLVIALSAVFVAAVEDFPKISFRSSVEIHDESKVKDQCE